ncbi:MAG: tripartite tricarboxylate transporter substrate binding protein [Betaproteobacteria bacterium]|nr:tripartite tricarboxylate transporter substrate binding protein [Betaproteobacteria bacterium]
MRNLPNFLLSVTLALGTVFAASTAQAQFPNKPIRVIVPWPAGGPSDTLARVVSGKAAEFLGQQMIIDNRVGASGVIGTEFVAKSAPDGYTLFWAIANHTTNHVLFKVSYDPLKDFAPVGQVARSSYMLLVNPELPVKSVKELVDYAKARAGRLPYASAGNGTLQHLGMELLKREARLDMVHVPYKGSAPAITDVLGGQVQVTFESTTAVMGHVRSGKLRALAVSTAKRIPQLPDLPTIAESGYPGYEVVGFTGVLAPAGTPPEVVGALNAAYNKALAAAEVREKMGSMGVEPAGSTPEQFRAFLQSEIPKYTRILKESGAKLD